MPLLILSLFFILYWLYFGEGVGFLNSFFSLVLEWRGFSGENSSLNILNQKVMDLEGGFSALDLKLRRLQEREELKRRLEEEARVILDCVG